MKMSKSIHDYKEAMDNIKISESFYKRTEVLLTEIPEVKIEKRSVISGRRVSTVIMSAAACVICLFGVKLAIDGRQADIVTETVTETGGSEGDITETGKEADELIDELSEYEDDIVAEDIEEDILDGGEIDEQVTPDSVEPIVANPAASPEPYAVSTEAPAHDPAKNKTTTTTTTETTAATSQTAGTTEKRVVQGIDPTAPTTGQNDAGGDEPTEAMPNPGASGGTGPDGDEIEDTEVEDDEAAIVEAEPTVSPTASAGGESASLFGELSFDNVTVDVTPYFDMGDIRSGEGTVKKSGTEFKPVLDLISGMRPSATKIGNSSFTSLFSIRIYDENIDLEFYSVYLTNHESIVITKHSPDGSQVRETYALRREYYESVRHQLFLLFGAEGDYELFTNLIGGK